MMSFNKNSVFLKIFDSALALGIGYTLLYFLGYTYYGAFCLYNKFKFEGIEVSTTDYLVAGWASALIVGYALFFVICLLFTVSLLRLNKKINTLMNRCENYFPNTFKKYACILFFLVYSFLVLVCGIAHVDEQAKSDVNDTRNSPRVVIFTDKSGKKTSDVLIYIKDFGKVMAVGEFSIQQKGIIGIKFINKYEYADYTLYKSNLKFETHDSLWVSY